MNRFSQLNIQPATKLFKGEKIKIKKVLDKEIVVTAYKIEPSKFEGKDDRLVLAIEFESEPRIIFTGSKYLKEAIVQVDKDSFPFTTVIKEENECFQFT